MYKEQDRARNRSNALSALFLSSFTQIVIERQIEYTKWKKLLNKIEMSNWLEK